MYPKIRTNGLCKPSITKCLRNASLAFAAGSVLISGGFAHAADPMQSPALPMPAQHYQSWDGFYMGLHTGMGSFDANTTDWGYDIFDDPDGDFDLTNFAALGGIQLGYNAQFGSAIVGVEADVAYTSSSEEKRFDSGGHYVKAELDWLTTVRGRLGLAHDNAMMYVTGGLAFASVAHCATDNDDLDCASTDTDEVVWSGVVPGLVVGAGAEYRFTDSLSLKGEYMFLQTAGETILYDEDNGYDVEFSHSAHMIRLGLNYNFSTF